MSLGIAIVGCGAVGRKRALAMPSDARLVVCADADRSRARSLAATMPGATDADEWRDAIGRSDVDAVIVATTNDALAEVAAAAVGAGKHVLVEKPAARSVAELEVVRAAASRASGVHVRVGFNHRYHPGLRKARELVDAGSLGDLMVVRGRYGHGGRRGYDDEWRADPSRSGGGELIDQGVHLIDLARWFLGELTLVHGSAHTYYWSMPVEDNAFLVLEAAGAATAFLHVSCTEWKNLFSLEIYGRDGKLHVDGLGGSYGTERLAHYRMGREMGPPDTTIWEYPRPDDSWSRELATFVDDIRLDRPPDTGLADAQAALAVVEQVYRASGYLARWGAR